MKRAHLSSKKAQASPWGRKRASGPVGSVFFRYGT